MLPFIGVKSFACFEVARAIAREHVSSHFKVKSVDVVQREVVEEYASRRKEVQK